MKAVSVKPAGYRSDGKRIVDALIVANTPPAVLPTSGENVEGLSKDDVFAPFSVIYVTGDASTKVYIANEDGSFIPQ